MTSLLWFRADLRLHDHPALMAATEVGPVAPVFMLDSRLLEGRWASPNRNWFMVESLRALDSQLRIRGNRLIVRRGSPERLIPSLAHELGADAVYVSREYTPFARRRDARVATELARSGIAIHARRGKLAVEPEDVRSGAGAPYSVFTPFSKRWRQVAQRAVVEAPASIPGVSGVDPGELPTDIIPTATELLSPGETAARARMESWLASPLLESYAERRDMLGEDATSRLSQDLRWGLISPVELLARVAARSAGPAAFATDLQNKFVSEVAWREFYHHLLWHYPNALATNFRQDLAAIPWRDDPIALGAWQSGRTGYPVVDAAIRQLVTTGWMHNRARMIVASFLTKHLLVHWQEGERFFMEHLIDGDVASNNGGWQWAASTGADPQPYFRIFNPILQGRRFDPGGDYVRRWLPALANVPAAEIHTPWQLSPMDQQEFGCVIGTDYPPPIVDHGFGRARALAAFETARSN